MSGTEFLSGIVIERDSAVFDNWYYSCFYRLGAGNWLKVVAACLMSLKSRSARETLSRVHFFPRLA
jgi:hypothetical protein